MRAETVLTVSFSRSISVDKLAYGVCSLLTGVKTNSISYGASIHVRGRCQNREAFILFLIPPDNNSHLLTTKPSN